MAFFERSYNRREQTAPRPPSADKVLQQKTVTVERKTFTLQYCENPRGNFLRIIEEVGQRRSMVVIPATGIDDVLDAVEEITPAEGADTTGA